jgi:DNA-binding IclR family transcriptional regulator
MVTDNRAKPDRPKSTELSQTLSRGLKLLDVIAAGREGVAVRELAAVMALPRSIVQRLLYTLEADGFLERHPSQVGYRLSIKLWSLGCIAMRRLNVRDVARPLLEELAAKSNEMVKLAVLDGHDVVYVDGIDSSLAVRAYIPIGGRATAESTATGRAILAFLPAEKLAALTASMSHQPRTRHSIVDMDAFAKELERIRKRGYALNRGERDEDVAAVAAPLLDAQGDAIGSIGIILPLSRLTSAKTAQMSEWLTTAAAAISARLGNRAGEPAKLKRVG